MTYSAKVNASKTIVNAVNGLRDKEYIVVSYGTDYDGSPQQYRITCSIYRDNKPSYSISRNDVWALDSMNIAEFTNTMAKAYTFDMMRQRTTYSFPLFEMTLVDEPFKATLHDLKF
jgi:hypothetical protein